MSDEQTETSALTRERGEAVQRVKELEEEVAIGGKLIDERDRVLDLLPCEKHGRCVPHAIEAIEQLQATLAERERELRALATRHDAMLLRLGEVERDLYDAFHKHGQDNGMWGKWCARLLTQRNTARQDAARLRVALEAVLPIVKEVAAIEQAHAALKGQH